MNSIQTTQTVDGIISSIYRQQERQGEMVLDAMAKNFWPMIGTANQVAYTAIEDAVDAMKEAGMWRQQEKVKAQKAIDEFHKYEHQAWVHFTELGDDRYPLWQDLVGRAAQKLEPDILKLYFAINNQIDKARVPNADVLAKIQVGVAMTTLATLMYDTLEAQFQSQTVINLRQAFCGGRITATEKNWRAVGEITGRKVMADANARHMRLGRSAIDALRDKGVLEAELMVDLFGSVLDGSLSGFSYRERWYIGVMGRVAYQRTIKKLQACSG